MPTELELIALATEFDLYLPFSKRLVLDLPEPQDRARAAQWLQFLRSITDDNFKKLRNEHLKLLLFALHRRAMVGIFGNRPPREELESFHDGLTLIEMTRELIEITEKQKTQVVEGGPCPLPSVYTHISNDLKEYMAMQTIPKFGAHCYYAVSSEPIQLWEKSPNSEDYPAMGDMPNQLQWEMVMTKLTDHVLEKQAEMDRRINLIKAIEAGEATEDELDPPIDFNKKIEVPVCPNPMHIFKWKPDSKLRIYQNYDFSDVKESDNIEFQGAEQLSLDEEAFSILDHTTIGRRMVVLRQPFMENLPENLLERRYHGVVEEIPEVDEEDFDCEECPESGPDDECLGDLESEKPEKPRTSCRPPRCPVIKEPPVEKKSESNVECPCAAGSGDVTILYDATQDHATEGNREDTNNNNRPKRDLRMRKSVPTSRVSIQENSPNSSNSSSRTTSQHRDLIMNISPNDMGTDSSRKIHRKSGDKINNNEKRGSSERPLNTSSGKNGSRSSCSPGKCPTSKTNISRENSNERERRKLQEQCRLSSSGNSVNGRSQCSLSFEQQQSAYMQTSNSNKSVCLGVQSYAGSFTAPSQATPCGGGNLVHTCARSKYTLSPKPSTGGSPGHSICGQQNSKESDSCCKPANNCKSNAVVSKCSFPEKCALENNNDSNGCRGQNENNCPTPPNGCAMLTERKSQSNSCGGQNKSNCGSSTTCCPSSNSCSDQAKSNCSANHASPCSQNSTEQGCHRNHEPQIEHGDSTARKSKMGKTCKKSSKTTGY